MSGWIFFSSLTRERPLIDLRLFTELEFCTGHFHTRNIWDALYNAHGLDALLITTTTGRTRI